MTDGTTKIDAHAIAARGLEFDYDWEALLVDSCTKLLVAVQNVHVVIELIILFSLDGAMQLGFSLVSRDTSRI